MDTVYEHCSQGLKKKSTKILKKKFAYNLIYEMFVLRLL